MAVKEKLIVGIVGCGQMAGEHLKIWNKIPKAEVSTLVDIDIESAKKMAETYGIKNYYNDLEEMSGVDAVDACVPPLAHREVAVKAFQEGYHVLMEKPLAMNLEDAKEIISAKRGRKLGIIHNWKFERHMRRAISLAGKGSLGKITKVEVKLLNPPDETMMQDKEHWCHSLQGGRLAEALPHLTYLLRAFLGDLEVKDVEINKRGKHKWVPYDELQATLMGKKQGIGTIYMSFNSPRHSILADIYGTESIVRVDLNVGIIRLGPSELSTIGRTKDIAGRIFQLASSGFQSLPEAISSKLAGKRSRGHEVCISNFIDCILGKDKPLVGTEDALKNVRLVEEITDKVEDTL